MNCIPHSGPCTGGKTHRDTPLEDPTQRFQLGVFVKSSTLASSCAGCCVAFGAQLLLLARYALRSDGTSEALMPTLLTPKHMAAGRLASSRSRVAQGQEGRVLPANTRHCAAAAQLMGAGQVRLQPLHDDAGLLACSFVRVATHGLWVPTSSRAAWLVGTPWFARTLESRTLHTDTEPARVQFWAGFSCTSSMSHIQASTTARLDL
jgi:hypothetical protein